MWLPSLPRMTMSSGGSIRRWQVRSVLSGTPCGRFRQVFAVLENPEKQYPALKYVRHPSLTASFYNATDN
jgi:hypothetical protein